MRIMKRFILFLLMAFIMLSNLTSVNALDLYSSERVFEYEIHIRSWDGFESIPSDYDEDLFLLIFGRQACTFTDWAIKSAQELTDQGYSVKTAIMLIDDNGQNKTPAELNALYPQMIVSDNYAENQKDYNNMRSKAVITGSTLPSVFLMNSERKVIFSSSSGEAVSKTAPKVRELLPDGGSASESLWFPLNVTYHQDDARSMLEMINGFRTGDEAWAWNSDDSEKEIYEDLGELTYDYELEKTAMQRAAELAVRFYHTRTDGTSCFTAYPDVFLGDKKAENILKGSENAEMTFTAFREDEMPFSTQAERRNMLSSKYTSVGIGCAEYNGVRYWVQEFSSSVQNTEAVDYEEKLTEVKIPVNQKSCQLQLESDVECYNTDQNIMLAIGETADFPSVSAKLIFDGDVIEDFGILTDYEISDPSLIKIENGEMSALNTGSLTIRWQKEYGSFAAELILNVTILKEHIHDYHVAWEWEEDYSAAKAVFTCRYNSAHTFITDAEVTSEVSREPNCMSDGERCFTASVIYEGKTYTDTRTEVMPATGEHTYTEPEYIWSDDYRRVDAFVICTVCGNRFSEPTWTEYSVVKEPGCEEPGIGRYTADFYDDPFECVTKDVELEPIGHSYQLSEWEWAEDCSSAEAVFICEHDSSHVHNETASIVSEIVEPTCGADGSGEYRASVTFEGNEYTDEKTAVIPATGNHEITSAEYTWSHDNKTVTAKAVCEECGNEVTETAETSYEVIKEATMDEEGTGRYTAVFENEFFETQTKDVVIPKISDTLPQSITLDIHRASILFDTSISLHAAVGPETALDKSVSWSSSDESVAIVGANGTVRGIKPGKATITATTVNGLTDTCEIRVLFTDVASSDQYFFNPVYWALDHEITVGAGGPGKFSPNADCTREQFVTFLWRAAGEPEPSEGCTFTDVSSDAWYYKSISWAYENGITTGLNDGTGRFGVGQACTREQCVTFIHRYEDKPAASKDYGFTDVEAGRYYYDAINWAAENGITVGLNDGTGRFGVGQKCRRGMLVTFLYRNEMKN